MAEQILRLLPDIQLMLNYIDRSSVIISVFWYFVFWFWVTGYN